MGIINLYPFGEININEFNDYYESEIQISNRKISVDLNFRGKNLDDSIIKKIQMFTKQISDFEKLAFDYLTEDFNKSKEYGVKSYMEHHLEVVEQDELKELFGTTNIDFNLFLSKLALKRIGFYPTNKDEFAVFDISLPYDFTDYLIVVYFDLDGNITNLSVES